MEPNEINEANPETIDDNDGDKKGRVKKEIMDWVVSILVAVVVALFLRTYVFTLVKVEGSSMEPTLQDSERLFVWRLNYEPKAGDIVIFMPNNDSDAPYVKRIIAVAGQEVEIRDQKVYVDGVEQNEPYINNPTRSAVSKYKITNGHVFCMGDNREHSRDSRSEDVGLVCDDSIMGKAVFRFFPFNNMGSL